MADQDFAQIEVTQPEEVRPMSQMKTLFLTLLALAVVAGGFASGFMIGQQTGIEKAVSKTEARLVAQLKKQKEELEALRAQAKQSQPEVSTTQVGELTFYNELPRQSVEPEPLTADPKMDLLKSEDVLKAADELDETRSRALLEEIIAEELNGRGGEVASAQAITSTPLTSSGSAGAYYLQLASFQQQDDAENFFPKLESAGYTGFIKSIEIDGRGLWYRVYAGPFSSKQLAENAKKKVKKRLNITGLIVKEVLIKDGCCS